MKTSLLIAILCISLSAQAAPKKTCEVCAQVEKMSKTYEADEPKGYTQFNDFLETVKLSSDKKILAEELKSIVTATPTFLKSDAPGELPAYLVDMEDAHPKEFAEALKGLPQEQREDLELKMKSSRTVMEEGEEGPNSPPPAL